LTTYQHDYQIATSAKMDSIREAFKSDSQGNQEPTSQRTLIYVVNLQWTLYNKAQQQVLVDVQQFTSGGGLVGDVEHANLEYLPLKGNLDNLVQLTESISQIVVQLNTSRTYPILLWTVIAFLFSTLVVFATTYVINLTITRPLRQIIHLTERIARGDTAARALVTGHDETYMVAASVNTMLDSVVSLMRNIQHQHDGLEAHIQKLIDEVKGLGTGDLRSRAEVSSDALGFLAHSFNYIIDELSGRIVRIKTVTKEVEMLTSITQQHITQVLQSSTYQVQNMTEAVRAVEQMIASTISVSEQSLSLSIIARETQQMAQNGYKAMERTGHGMERMMAFELIAERIEQQRLAIESINIGLNQQLHLSRSVLYIVQNAAEANRKSSDSTNEATRSIGRLSHLVGLLHSSLGIFKLRGEL
jgi:methyl-accepting chemotaxis protein